VSHVRLDGLRRRRADFFDVQGVGRFKDRQGGPWTPLERDGGPPPEFDVRTPGDAREAIPGRLEASGMEEIARSGTGPSSPIGSPPSATMWP
jgi:hypothetical protein